MTDRIFVATDLSSGADEGLRAAHARAALTKADVAVCYVHADFFGARSLFAPNNDKTRAQAAAIEGRVRELLADRVAACMPGDHPELLVEHGPPHRAVLRRAEDWSADVIVVGSTGHTGVSRLLLGNVAEQIVRHAHCPVLIARRAPASGVVVVATDLSDPAMPAIAAGRDEAARRGARLVVVHAIEFGSVGVTIEEVALDIARPNASWNVDERLRTRALAELRSAVESCGATASDLLVLDGAPGAAILRVADRLDAELVVIGTRGRTGLTNASVRSQPASQGVAVSAELARACNIDVNNVQTAPKFDFDQSALAGDDRDVLGKVARCLTTGPLKGRAVKLVGHTDPRGEPEYNMGLGEHRADSVRSYLTQLGVENRRIAESSRGELDASGHDDPSWRLDRRVDVRLQ